MANHTHINIQVLGVPAQGHTLHWNDKGYNWEFLGFEPDQFRWVCLDGRWLGPKQRMNWSRLIRMVHDNHLDWGSKATREFSLYEKETLVIVNGF